jgi:thymidylate synthase (FAD)
MRVITPTLKTTQVGTKYFDSPGIALLCFPSVDLRGTYEFLEQLNCSDYLNDTPLPAAETVCKFAGQLCYKSFGPKRTYNADAKKYFDSIKSQGHGSVLEHVNYGFLLWGVSRSFTHELVRHRQGCGYSQLSQRYDDKPRFVERPEYVYDHDLHTSFCDRIDNAAQDYDEIAKWLRQKHKGETTLERKEVNQVARSLLPNETEAPIYATFNVRALRHILEMRASQHAETEIRRVAFGLYTIVKEEAPLLFDDYEVSERRTLSTAWRKV